MEKHQRHPLAPQQAERFLKPFPITSVCRADLVQGLDITEAEALRICDSDMEEIARKLADAYCENGFWIDLPIVAEHVLGEREA